MPVFTARQKDLRNGPERHNDEGLQVLKFYSTRALYFGWCLNVFVDDVMLSFFLFCASREIKAREKRINIGQGLQRFIAQLSAQSVLVYAKDYLLFI